MAQVFLVAGAWKKFCEVTQSQIVHKSVRNVRPSSTLCRTSYPRLARQSVRRQLIGMSSFMYVYKLMLDLV